MSKRASLQVMERRQAAAEEAEEQESEGSGRDVSFSHRNSSESCTFLAGLANFLRKLL